jgi:hypothetical protein
MSTDATYHETLNALANASRLPREGVMFNTQIRKKLMTTYLYTIATTAIKMFGEVEAAKIRQDNDCSQCARFMARMGSVVCFDGDNAVSVFWNPDVVEDPLMKAVVAEMKRIVEESRVVSIFNPDGQYSKYEPITVNGGKTFSHLYYPMHSLYAENRDSYNRQKNACTNDTHQRLPALVRMLASQEHRLAALQVDCLFSAGKISHVGSSKEALESFNWLANKVSALESKPEYIKANKYTQETMSINLIWNMAMKMPGLVTVPNSSLGALIKRRSIPVNGEEQAIAQWKTITNGVNYRRPKVDASALQIQVTMDWLKENDYMRSLEQVPLLQEELPVIYKLPVKWTGRATLAPTMTDSSFEAFASKAVGKDTPTIAPVALSMDFSTFINRELEFVESAMVNLAGMSVMPVFYNRMGDLTAKPIFMMDTPEKRVPYIGFNYVAPLEARWLTKETTPVHAACQFPITAITSRRELGIHPEADYDNQPEEVYYAVLDDIVNPQLFQPTLFAASLKPEFYPHRRVLEQYMKDTFLAPVDGQIAVTLPFIQLRRGEASPNVVVVIEVTYNEQGRAARGSHNGVYHINPRYVEDVKLDKLRQLGASQVQGVTDPVPTSTEQRNEPVAETRPA